jgi:hypothetical protein
MRRQQDLTLLLKETNLEILFTSITLQLLENMIYGYQMIQDWQDYQNHMILVQ